MPDIRYRCWSCGYDIASKIAPLSDLLNRQKPNSNKEWRRRLRCPMCGSYNNKGRAVKRFLDDVLVLPIPNPQIPATVMPNSIDLQLATCNSQLGTNS